MTLAAQELRLPLPRRTLAARAWGDPSLPPLLALHGWLDNAGSFDRLAPLLATQRYVVALDLPGHGRSDHRPPGTWYQLADYLDDIEAALAWLGWSRCDLLGHSLGGALAGMHAAAFPERVAKLLLIEALGPLSTAEDETLALLRRATAQRAAFRDDKLRLYPDLDAAIRARCVANGLSTTAARCLVERGLKAVDGGFVWSSDPRLKLASPMRYSEPQVLDLLRGIRAPTLLLLAEPAAPYLPRAQIDARIAQVADLRVARYPGNHHLHLETPEPIAVAIGGFLDGINPAV